MCKPRPEVYSTPEQAKPLQSSRLTCQQLHASSQPCAGSRLAHLRQHEPDLLVVHLDDSSMLTAWMQSQHLIGLQMSVEVDEGHVIQDMPLANLAQREQGDATCPVQLHTASGCGECRKTSTEKAIAVVIGLENAN